MLSWLRYLWKASSAPSWRQQEIDRLRTELVSAQSDIRRIQAGYDAAAHNDETLGLWSKADNLSARLANSLDVRKPLRERSRHEAGNGAHMRGITLTLANDLVGTGAQLQVLLESEADSDQVEKAWNEWAGEIGLDQYAHTYVLADAVDGEGTAKIITNDDLYNSVKLDVQVFDCDLMSTPQKRMQAGDILVDGIEFNKFGKPSAYHVLKTHPSEIGLRGGDDFDVVPARNILHFFRIDRPQQCRGIPLLTPALLIFAHLREYDDAVLKAARVAACLSALIHTKSVADGTPFESCSMTATDMEPGMLVACPDGYDVTQLRPEQPTATYDAFVQRKLSQACHAVNLPYSIATGDFSKESYAGGRMGRQVYHSGVAVRRCHLNARFYDRIFYAWLQEAVKVPKLLPSSLSAVGRNIPHEWHYDPWEHIDETKAAQAATINLGNFTTTLAEECAKRKKDWRKVIKQRALEINMQRAEGVLILPPGTPPLDGQADAGNQQDSGNGVAA